MRLRLIVLAALAATCACALATGALARHQPNGVVPLFCTSDTIPAGMELKLRIRWVTKNEPQERQFLDSQKLTWTVYSSDGTVRASRQTSDLSPEYGDKTYWSEIGHLTGTDINGDGKLDDVYYADYLVSTGIVLAAGEQVRVAHLLVANSKTDDGFYPGVKAGQPISSGENCMVTGV
jgi:hypothetical protein